MIATGNHDDFDSPRVAPRPYGYGGRLIGNYGMIATGNHGDFDSLRGAPRPYGVRGENNQQEETYALLDLAAVGQPAGGDFGL